MGGIYVETSKCSYVHFCGFIYQHGGQMFILVGSLTSMCCRTVGMGGPCAVGLSDWEAHGFSDCRTEMSMCCRTERPMDCRTEMPMRSRIVGLRGPLGCLTVGLRGPWPVGLEDPCNIRLGICRLTNLSLNILLLRPPSPTQLIEVPGLRPLMPMP